MTGRLIAIDGAAGSGKSTLARALSERLGLPYINTGLMYRALTAAALASGTNLDDGVALAKLMEGLRFSLRGSEAGELEIEGCDASVLTSVEVEAHVSQVAGHREVRARMKRAQRSLGARGGVMEGRDIGSVVFPDAPAKLFLTAAPQIRGTRRIGEREAPPTDVVRALHARDERDAKVQPLEPASDAVVIDTTGASPEETLERALEIVLERLA